MTDISLASILLWCFISFFTTGLVGNVLVIRIVHKTRAMHTTANFLLANVAVSVIITVLVGICLMDLEDLLASLQFSI